MYISLRPLGLGLLLMLAALVLTACGGAATAAAPPTASPQPVAVGRGGGGGAGRGTQATGDEAQADGQARASGTRRGEGGGGGGGNGSGGAQARASASPGAANPNVNGEVDIIEGRTITVATNTGWRKVLVPESARIQTEGKGTAGDLAPGVLVGVTGRPDGTAASIRLFGPGVTPRTGQFPMNGAQAGNTMTNAKIAAFDGQALALDLDGQSVSVTVTADTDISKPVAAAFADIELGARVSAFGTLSGDTVTAQSVTIFTQPRSEGTGGGQRGGQNPNGGRRAP